MDKNRGCFAKNVRITQKEFGLIFLLMGVLGTLIGCLPKSQSNILSPTDTSINGTLEGSEQNGSGIVPTLTSNLLTPTITPSYPTLPPTLTVDESTDQLNSFLGNISSCQLPCWFGITPGSSDIADVQNQINIFSNIAEDVYVGQSGDSWSLATIDVNYPTGNTVVRIFTAFLAPIGDNLVGSISVSTQALPKSLIGRVYGDAEYNDVLTAYSLPAILATYGVPDLLYFTADIYEYEQNAPDYFEIRLLYPKLGVFAKYTMPAETLSTTYRFCPSNSLIDFDLISPELGRNYSDFLIEISSEWKDFFPPSPYHKPPIEASGITNEEFFHIFTTTGDYCLESPISIWPQK